MKDRNLKKKTFDDDDIDTHSQYLKSGKTNPNEIKFGFQKFRPSGPINNKSSTTTVNLFSNLQPHHLSIKGTRPS
jgi:hypothetical protein